MKWKAILIIALSLVVVQTTFAKGKKKKKITLTGYVVDGNNQPIKGITLFVDGVAMNKHTNKKGFYKIKVKPTAKSLMVYSPEHGGLEIEFANKRKINFVLAPSTVDSRFNISEEKLVDIGYGKMKASDASSSVGSMNDLKSKSENYTNIFDMIKGQFSGVQVNGSSITIRGGSGSLMGSNNALIIVDGMESSSISSILPSDVESISVLKGSSATIYGTRGANGVLVIKTKGRK